MEMFELIHKALLNTTARYLIRDQGSYVEGQTRDKTDQVGGDLVRLWLSDLPWKEVTSWIKEKGQSYGQCRYFEAELPSDVRAFEAVRRWADLSPAEQAEVEITVSGHASDINGHKYDLLTKKIAPVQVGFVTLSIGNATKPDADPSEDPTVYAWVPGHLGAFTPITEEMVRTRNFPPGTAIKLVG